ATTKQTGALDVGDTWEIGIQVNADTEAGGLVDAVVTVKAVKPSEPTTPIDLSVEHLSTGKYRATYVLDEPGRHIATAAAAGPHAAVETFTVTAHPAAAQLPGVPEVTEYLGSLGVVEDPDQVADALAAEVDAQAAVCKVPASYTADLAQALKRRVARNLAMRNVQLGIQASEAGGVHIGASDPEVRRLERPYRKHPIG
ncbi:MAG TPA: hypothetical protein VGD43_01385, partial [Micromonospora sp.]